MANQATKDSIIISRKTVQKYGGVVVLPIREYKDLQERAVPTYQLYGKEAEELDKLVEEGLRDYKAGRCKKIKSLADLD